jgi:hypothetical protein
MPRAKKKKDVIAVGPVFNGGRETVSSQRVMLVKNRSEEGDTKEYVIISGSQPKRTANGTGGPRKLTKTPDFTHAVRVFCDRILDQAWKDDQRHDGEVGR